MGWYTAKTPEAQIYDLPVIGNDLSKIGRIIDLWANPCSPTPELWVKGFFTAIPTLFVSVTKPEIIDVNIPHRGRKQRKGKKLRLRPRDIFRDALIEVPVPRWVVFRLYESYQRIAYWFLVADALEDFGINWMSLAYAWNGCANINIPYINWERFPTRQPHSGGAEGIMPSVLRSVNLMSASPGHGSITRKGTYRVTWALEWQADPVTPQATILYTRLMMRVGTAWVDSGLGAESSETPFTGYSAGGGEIVAELDNDGPSFAVWMKVGVGGWFTYNNTITCVQVSGLELSPDP